MGRTLQLAEKLLSRAAKPFIHSEELQGVCANTFWVATVERLRKIQPRRGGIDVSPGRKPWVKQGK
jgi:hypothetical protein